MKHGGEVEIQSGRLSRVLQRFAARCHVVLATTWALISVAPHFLTASASAFMVVSRKAVAEQCNGCGKMRVVFSGIGRTLRALASSWNRSDMRGVVIVGHRNIASLAPDAVMAHVAAQHTRLGGKIKF